MMTYVPVAPGHADARLPEEWFAEPQDWSGPPDQVARVALSSTSHPVHRTVSATSATASQALERELYLALGRPKFHAIVDYPYEAPSLRAAVSLAAWLGLGSSSLATEVGGHIGVVQSGSGHCHDQDWHTDSTPWALPNRWTVLGQLALSDQVSAPPATGILPLASVTALLAMDADVLTTLRGTPVEWRAQFANLPPLAAPILDPNHPRWVYPVVAEQLAHYGPALSHAVKTLAAVLAESTDWLEVTIRPGRLLLFDNQAVLHRAPLLDQSAGRQLIRIKIGGRPLI